MKNARYALLLIAASILLSCSTGPDPEPDPTFYTVSVSLAPPGGGTVSPSADSTYRAGSTVSLQAHPGDGYEFSGWSGDVESSDNPLTITVDRDLSLTANFTDTDALFYLHENGVTVRCPGAEPGWTGTVNGTGYVAADRALLEQKMDDGADLSAVCTTPVTDMSSLFAGYEDFNQDIGSWDVSNVTDMHQMFDAGPAGAPEMAFNRDISHWDVGRVTDMSHMFHGAILFNQDIGSWDVRQVTDMAGMFMAADSFNQDLNRWDVSTVTNMSHMFAGSNFYGSGATNFNGNISGWDVSSVTDMIKMFDGAESFNSDIGGWDVSNVTAMTSMFNNAENFNQDLSGWCVHNIDEEPFNFSEGSALIKEYHPVWGTCPQ